MRTAAVSTPSITGRKSDMASYRRQITVVALMVACSVMSYFDRTIMSIAGPEVMKEFDLSATQMGSVYSAFILSYAILMIPGGHVADRLGPRLTLLLMNLSAALFTGLTAFGGRPGLGSIVGVLPALIAIRLGLGVGTAPLYPACARMSAHWIPIAHQGAVQGLIIAGSSLGGAVSPLLFSWLISLYQWRMSFFIAAVATAGLAVLWFWSVRDYPAGAQVNQSHPAGSRRVAPTVRQPQSHAADAGLLRAQLLRIHLLLLDLLLPRGSSPRWVHPERNVHHHHFPHDGNHDAARRMDLGLRSPDPTEQNSAGVWCP